MRDSYDVVIVGGAVIGSAVAYFLAANPDFGGTILVVERDPSYRFASTSLSSSSIRTQFSNPVNVRISQYGSAFIQDFAGTMQVTGEAAPDLNFHQGGYLFLASSAEQEMTLRENHEVQRACGADVVLWDQADLNRAFPHLNVDDIRLASYGRSGEGWFSNTGLMNGFKAKARELGAEYVADEVTAIGRSGDRVGAVTLKSGATVGVGTIVNASGPRAALTARMAGLHVPVEPRKRTLFVFDCAATPEGSATVNQGRLPLMIDPSGTFCRPEGRFFLSGCAPISVAWGLATEGTLELMSIGPDGSVTERAVAGGFAGVHNLTSITGRRFDGERSVIARSIRFGSASTVIEDIVYLDPTTQTWLVAATSTPTPGSACSTSGNRVAALDAPGRGIIGMVEGPIARFDLASATPIDPTNAVVPRERFCKNALTTLAGGAQILTYVDTRGASGLLWRPTESDAWAPLASSTTPEGDAIGSIGDLALVSGKEAIVAIFQHVPSRPEVPPRQCHELVLRNINARYATVDAETVFVGGFDDSVFLDF